MSSIVLIMNRISEIVDCLEFEGDRDGTCGTACGESRGWRRKRRLASSPAGCVYGGGGSSDRLRSPQQCAWYCAGQSVVFCDSSTVFTPFWRDILLEHLEQWPDIGVVGAVSRGVKGIQGIDLSAHGSESLESAARKVFGSHRGQHAYASKLEGSMVMVRSDLIERVGGFDVRFESSGMDWFDWSRRARLAGSRIRVAQDCLVQWSEPNVDQDALERGWDSLKKKWNCPSDWDFDQAETLLRSQDAFHGPGASWPIREEDVETLLLDTRSRFPARQNPGQRCL